MEQCFWIPIPDKKLRSPLIDCQLTIYADNLWMALTIYADNLWTALTIYGAGNMRRLGAARNWERNEPNALVDRREAANGSRWTQISRMRPNTGKGSPLARPHPACPDLVSEICG